MSDLLYIMAGGWLATTFLFLFLLIRMKRNMAGGQGKPNYYQMKDMEKIKKMMQQQGLASPEPEPEPVRAEADKDYDMDKFIDVMSRLERVLVRIERGMKSGKAVRKESDKQV